MTTPIMPASRNGSFIVSNAVESAGVLVESRHRLGAHNFDIVTIRVKNIGGGLALMNVFGRRHSLNETIFHSCGWAGNLTGLMTLLIGCGATAGHSVVMRSSVVFMFCVSF